MPVVIGLGADRSASTSATISEGAGDGIALGGDACGCAVICAALGGGVDGSSAICATLDGGAGRSIGLAVVSAESPKVSLVRER